jgi:23S rRNA pseudouridine1911/1915/1917 synthase
MIEQIPTALGGERLDRIVAMITGRSRTEAATVIASGVVTVDGKAETSGKVRLEVGQTVDAPEMGLTEAQRLTADPTIEIEVLYADDHVIVINKPDGLVVHPAPGHAGGTLVHGLLALYPEIRSVGELLRPGIVHRLDKGTSGLMVVARTQHAYVDLVEQLSVHAVTRRYAALVWGSPEHDSGTIDAPIGRRPKDPLKMAIVADGKRARTTYEVTHRFREPKEMSQVNCWLETGRTHQIRVHLTGIGHPVVGDLMYGRRRELPGAERPMLHAHHLAFKHPGTGGTVEFDAPIAADMATVLSRCS